MDVDTQPAAPPDSAALNQPLYSPGQVTAAAFLGSPLAGCWLLAANFKALGKRDASRQALAWGAGATLVLLGIAFILPEHFPRTALPVAYTFTLRERATHLQGKAFRAHIDHGGKKRSSWRVLGIGLACLAVVCVAAVAVSLVLPPPH